MASPWTVGLVVFIAAPMLLSLLLAFMRWSGLTAIDQAEWVGLANFREMLAHDERFRRSAWITVVYAMISVPAGQVVALGAAMLLVHPVRGVNIFRAMWYLPTVLAGVAMAILWWSVFDAESGLMNDVLRPVLGLVGLRPPAWFGADARWAGVMAYAIASLWTFGGAMLIYLAGLHAIPKDLYEAAQMDGAGPLRRLRTVTLPMLSPVILFNVVIAIIASFQVFTQAYIMTKGGPGDATLFFVLYLYEEAFEHHEMGYASALAWALFVVVFALTLVVLRLSRKRVHYEGVAP
jgi:multiple sugar transport system permease protein